VMLSQRYLNNVTPSGFGIIFLYNYNNSTPSGLIEAQLNRVINITQNFLEYDIIFYINLRKFGCLSVRSMKTGGSVALVVIL